MRRQIRTHEILAIPYDNVVAIVTLNPVLLMYNRTAITPHWSDKPHYYHTAYFPHFSSRTVGNSVAGAGAGGSPPMPIAHSPYRYAHALMGLAAGSYILMPGSPDPEHPGLR